MLASRCALCAALGLLACGGGAVTVETPAPATAAPTAEPAAPPAAEPKAEEKPAPAAPEAGAKPEGAAPETTEAKPKKPPSGRPSILMGPQAEITTTFGSTPGAVLKLKGAGGNVTLKIPEYALAGAINLEWKVVKERVKTKHPVLGAICLLRPTPAGKQEPARVETDGDPFQVRVPVMGKATVSLAIGEIDFRKGTDAVGWTLHAPKRIDGDEALFELTSIGHAYVHATTATPAEAKPKEDK